MQTDNMASREPRWRRRSAERPHEIADAALAAFATRGYAATRLADIAREAGVSKAALYLYYPTKADLFRAVLLDRIHDVVQRIAAPSEARFADMIAGVLQGLAEVIARPELRRLARMVIAESGNFPELAAAWHETVVGPAIEALTSLIARAQARGEARGGDPRLMAYSVIGPMIAALIWREVIEPAGGAPVDFARLAASHAAVLSEGLGVPA